MRCPFRLVAVAGLVLAGAFGQAAPAGAGTLSFDFENATQHAPLPISLTVGGLTANFSAGGVPGLGNYSVQLPFDVLGFVPGGFSGLSLWPTSINSTDLLVSFSQPIVDFSILYSVQDLNTSTSSTMQVRAYTGSTLVGSSTMTAPEGTWPTATLSFDSALGFDNVVIHYLLPPPTGGDFGEIFAVDNMQVTTGPSGATPLPAALPLFASGLGALGLLSWRRKRKASAAT